MKKSPFSTPRGNGSGRQGFGWNSGGSPGRGYGRPKNYDYYSPNRSLNSSSQSVCEDFIPFDVCTTPTSDRESTGNWQSPVSGQWHAAGRGNRRQSSSPGYNNYRDNRSRGNHQQSPYHRDGGNSFRGNRKNFHRGVSNRRIDIAKYMNLQSFLEDPWAKLSQQLSNNKRCDDSQIDTSSDFSFSSGVFDAVRLNDSVDEDNLTSSQEGIEDSCVESETSILRTSQGSVDISSENSLDIKTSQDSKD